MTETVLCHGGTQDCINTHYRREEWDEEVIQLEVEGQEAGETEQYTLETDDDTQSEIYEDEGINNIMEMVFGEDCEAEYM